MVPEVQSQSTKMFGYMERRGKMTIRGRWKQRWCVLEGHLLLYYKSQAEYLKLSPCCGSLNMTLVRKIQPNVGCLIHIMTHSQTIILRTPNKEKQEQWFNALASVLMQDYREDSRYPTASLFRKPEKRKPRRSVRISETSEQNHSRDSKFDSEEENNNSTKLTSSSDVSEKMGSQPILKRNSHNDVINRCSSDSKIYAFPMKNNFREFQRSFSCGCIPTQLSRNQSIASKSIWDDFRDRKKKRGSKVHWNDAEIDTVPVVENSEHVPRRNSKKRNKNKIVHRHSLNFLKIFLTKRESREWRKEVRKQQIKALQDLNNCFFTSIVAVTTTLNIENDSEETPHSQEPLHESSNSVNSVTNAEETTVSTTNTNESIKIEESRSWTMIEYERTLPNDEVLPELPPKTRGIYERYSWQKRDVIKVKTEMVDSSTTSNPNTELDQLMSQLIDMTGNPNFLHKPIRPSSDNIPDYDIPRSHLSIISEKLSDPTDIESSSIGSLNYRNSLSASSVYPDSLEMGWPLNDEPNNRNYWPTTSGNHYFLRDSIEYDDRSYWDSLNT